MKFKFAFLSLLAVATLTIAGCQKPDPVVEPEVSISVSPTVLNFDGNTGSSDVTVTATDSWSVSGVPSWMTLTPSSGKSGNTKVTVSVQAGAESARNAEITFKASTKTASLSVNQEAAPVAPPEPTPTLTGDVTSVELKAADTEATFKITAKDLKGKWTVSPKATYDWVTDYTKEGTTSGNIVVKVAANSTDKERKAEFTVASEGATSVGLTLTQKGAEITVATDVAGITAQITSTDNKNPSKYAAELKEAVVSYVNGNYAYIEDKSGAIVLYLNGHGLEAGKKISGPLSGTGYIYNGLPEITGIGTDAKIEDGGIIPLTVMTIADLDKNFKANISRRIRLEGVTVKDAISKSDRNGVVTQGSNEMNVYAQKSDGSLEMEVGAKGDLICYPTMFKETKQVSYWSNDDFASNTPSITTTKDKVEIEGNVTEAKFTIAVKNLKEKWMITPKEQYDWVIEYPTSGTAGGDILVKVAANTTGAARTAELQVTSEGAAPLTLTIVQKAGSAATPTLTVEAASVQLQATDTKATFKLTVKDLKGKWTVTPKETYSWVTNYTKEGTASGDIAVTVTSNTTDKERKAEFTVASEGASNVVLTVTQAAGGSQPPTGNTIKTADELLAWLKDASRDVELAADIDLTGKTFTPDTLYMSLDGKGHKITYNLKYEGTEAVADNPSVADWGLFRFVAGSVKNLKVAGSLEFAPAAGSGTYHVGGIAARVGGAGSIENCESQVNILGTTKVTHHMGGIAGFMDEGSKIKGCVNKGKVEMIIPNKGAANASQLGGIVGHIEGEGVVENCTNDGQVTYEGTGTPRVAGICGYVNNLVNVTFKNCTNNGLIQINEGNYSDTSWSYVGGVTGYYGTPTVDKGEVLYDGCVNNGKIELNITETKTKMRVGGIAAHGGKSGEADGCLRWTFKNCTNNGEIVSTSTTANNYLGGILGFSEVSCLVICDGCTNTGKISTAGNGFVGGILGRSCSVNSSFTNFKVTNKTVLEVKNASGKAGLIMGYNTAITTAMTGTVAGKIIRGSETIEISASNYADNLLNYDLGPGGSVSSVKFGN